MINQKMILASHKEAQAVVLRIIKLQKFDSPF
jgi:hypothetical protein